MHEANPTIEAAVMELYHRAEVTRADPRRCITPLSELLGAYNLTCRELRGLTGRKAGEELLQHGAVAGAIEDVGEPVLAGYLFANGELGAIFVEADDRLTRRRFSVAHELGHFVLHFRPILRVQSDGVGPHLVASDVFPGRDSDESTPADLPEGRFGLTADAAVALPPYQQMEYEANQFAVELLMPLPVLWELVDRYRPTYRDEDLIWRLATDMLVSRAAMRWRLRGLGLLSTRLAGR